MRAEPSLEGGTKSWKRQFPTELDPNEETGGMNLDGFHDCCGLVTAVYLLLSLLF